MALDMKNAIARGAKKPPKQPVEQSPTQKTFRTAKWARIMTKWLISHSSKGGVRWQVVNFTGPAGQESTGIVDMIAIRKRHRQSENSVHRGDLFEIILIQVKGGTAKFPSPVEIDRLVSVKNHHRADKVVLTEWKRRKKLCCYLLPDTTQAVPASEIFGKVPNTKRMPVKVLAETAT
jgi:hypothetical protein